MPHMLLRTAFAAGATTALMGTAALAAPPAGATTAPSPATSSAPSSDVAAAKPPPLKNYENAISDPVALPDMTQQRGTVHCAIGSVPLGGGVITQSGSMLVSVNSSFPVVGGWSADVSNVSGADTTFEVKVICAAKPAHYVKVVSPTKPNPAATHTTVAATCPIGTKPLGGGAASSSGSAFVTLSSTAPSGTRAWQISENNATGEDAKVAAYALCANVPGYVVARGPVLSIPGNSIASLGARCPGDKLPTGGGAVIQSKNIGAYLNLTTLGASHDWVSFVTNSSAVPFKASTTIVCATVPS